MIGSGTHQEKTNLRAPWSLFWACLGSGRSGAEVACASRQRFGAAEGHAPARQARSALELTADIEHGGC